jgi:hypothetical protein
LRLISRRHSFAPARAAFAPLEESKVVSSHPFMVNPRQIVRAIVFASLLLVLSAASVSLAYGQSFTLSVPAGLHQPSVDPGGSSTAIIDLGASGGFDSPVSLSCTVTSTQVSGPPPQCTVSPQSQIPPADGPSLTITTTGGSDGTPAGTYPITVTGTSGSITQSVTLYLNVTDLTEDYTLSVSPTTAIPSPVPAGSQATTTVTVTPIGDYTGYVTLSCLSIAPIVTAAPYCSFAATTGSTSLPPGTVQVTSGAPATATLTISTYGPTTVTTRRPNRSMFYAFWLAIPGLALVGVGATRRHRKKLMGVLLLLAVANGLLLLPACGTTTTGTAAPNGQITPNNTYTFTLTGADQNGVGPSNLNCKTCEATVSLAVN